MPKIRLLNLTTTQDATVTSPSFIIGGRQSSTERGRSIVTLIVTGDVGSANGDTVRFEIGADSASGVFVLEKLDPLAVLDHVDASGEFISVGGVDVETAPGVFGRVVFRAPGGNGTSSISVWAVGAVATADSSARGTPVNG